ncbi:MAG: right-handed parallel beta-helix repeat-containing protein [Phycisphaerae bacterium]|nr:right-handed parallel beta-helix repeat-containing protein [Phycisphaerae bacterium]
MPYAVLLIAALLTIPAFAQQMGPPRVVTENLKLDKDAVLDTPLVIRADGVTIDGNGATLRGPGKAGNLKSFVGVGILAEGRSRVTIRNIKIRGFNSALEARDGAEWTIEGCDFSDNYHDPDYGWGDGDRNGGIILTRMQKCVIRNNKANHVWNGLDLWESSHNLIEKNDFSHCSNVCLKMWLACRNVVRDNNLSWGLRMKPGEVHARDSTSVLMETGSNDNLYERNDITHGGDGVFLRPLNGWVQTGNVFIENDCSYANNNGFESWSPGNTFIRNKANHCSYGFWLGGSDHTVLIGNEAAFNGLPDGKHNAPEADFNHGGIVIVGGSGSHTVIDGNYCHDNNGAGIVFRGDAGSRGVKWKMYHLIVQNNRLENNRWGLFARFTDSLYLANNTFRGNREQDEFMEEVTNLVRGQADPEGKNAPKAVLDGPSRARVGERVAFDASGSKDEAGRALIFRWDVAGKEYTTAKVEHAFDKPGFYRVSLTVSNGFLAGLAFRDFYVIEELPESATEGQATQWGWGMGNDPDKKGKVRFTDDANAIVGKTSLRVRPDPYQGADVTLTFPKDRNAGWDLTGKKALTLWIRFENPNNGGFQGPNPIIRLHSGKAAYSYLPAYHKNPRNLLGDLPYPEARYGWLRVAVPLAGSDEWIRSESLDGAVPPHIDNAMCFETVDTPMESQSDTSLVSTGQYLFCAMTDGDQLWRSESGKDWTGRKSPSADLKSDAGGWQNQMLAYGEGADGKGSLIVRHTDPRRDQHGQNPGRYVVYDIEKDTWRWTATWCSPSHGTAVVGHYLYGISHAVGGNYGGPISRFDLSKPTATDERTVLEGLKGDRGAAWWFSRAAKLVAVAGRVYGMKNDWTTPQPGEADKSGDRLFVFDPEDYRPSSFGGGFHWDEKQWKEARTPVTDLGSLPFEVGHGSALVALPPHWSTAVGGKGGLFIVAASSPSNNEGYGQPSDSYAIYDIATARYTVLGHLPGPTGSGTSAAFHQGKVFIKRGGMNYAPTNDDLWVVKPLSPEEAQTAKKQVQAETMSLRKVDCITLQFDSMGNDPFDLWVDGLNWE